MRRIRRLSGVSVAAAAIGLAVAGCGGGSVTGNSGGGSGKTTITVWEQVTGSSTTTLNSLVSKFNSSQSKYTVNIQFAADSDQFDPKLLNAVKNGVGPNMVLGDSTPQSLSEIVQTGKVVDLDSLLSASGATVTKSSFTAGMLSTGTINGKIYSLPTDGGDYGLVYNKQMFTAAGISSPPTTWAQVATDAAKLTKNGTYGIYLPIGNGEWTVFTWESMLWGAGGELLNPANTSVEFNSSAGVKALTTWTSLLKDKVAYPQSLETPSDSQGISSLSARKVAMVITGAYNLGTLDTALGASNVGTAALPTVSEPAMNLGTDNSYILTGTAAQQAGSWAFLQYWLKPSTQAAWDIATGYLPTNQATTSNASFKSYLAANPRLQPFVDELSYARARPSILAYAAVSTALGNQLERAMLLQESPSAALSAAAKGAQSALTSG